MQILVADGDRRFLELLRGVVEGEGHTVTVADTSARALDQLRSLNPELVIADLDMDQGQGAAFLRKIRASRGADQVHIVATTARRSTSAPDIKALLSECRVDAILRKPFPMFDLVDQIRDIQIELGPAAPDTPDEDDASEAVADFLRRGHSTPAPATSDTRFSDVRRSALSSYASIPLDERNLQRVAGLWARRESGVLRLTAGPGGAEGWMVMAEGGPLDSDGWELLSAALHGGVMEFERRKPTTAAGDFLGLGAMLYGRAREPDDDGFISQHAYDAVTRSRYPDALAAVPLSRGTRAILELISPFVPIGELPERAQVDRAEVSADLAALARLGLVELGVPQERPLPPTSSSTILPRQSYRSGGVPDPAAAAPPSAPPDSATSDSAPSNSAPSDAVSRSSLRERIAARSREAKEGSISRTGGRHYDLDSQPSQPTAIDMRSFGGKTEDSSGPVSRPADWARLRRRMAHRGKSWSTRRLARQSTRERDRRVRHLRKERDLLRDQGPAVVLGLPLDAPATMIDEAAERMKARYESMKVDPQLPKEGQALAGEILTMVEAAHERLTTGGGRLDQGFDDPPEPEADHERYLAAARHHMDRGEWTPALTLLRRARDEVLGDPTVLACLGWVTLHDDSMSEAEREEEARGLLLLAVQFGPDDFDANYYLARFLADRGEERAGLARAARALKLRPDHAPAKALVRKLRPAVQAE